MREVLFKGKMLHNNEWIEGGLVQRDGKAYIIGVSKKLMIDGIEVDPETVCQFIGLYDKNKNRIYENDICIDDECTYLVQYNNECACVELVEYEMSGSYTESGWDEVGGVFEEVDRFGLSNYIDLNEWFNVIGNKFDNPELLDR